MFEKKYANLHFHSTHSDGVDTPEKLVEIAVSEGYKALSLTDHDTATGNVEMQKFCDKAGLEYIMGCEFTGLGFDNCFHITAFDFDANEKGIREHLQYMSDKCIYRTKGLFDAGLERGTLRDITWNEVLDANPGKMFLCVDHVFATMKEKGIITDDEYPQFHRDNFSYQIPFEEKLPYRQAVDVIKTIRNAGGVPVLAHPGFKQMKYIEELVKMGLMGIETWHADHTDEEAEYARELCEKYNLYISGGTDHSGLMGGQYKFYEGKDENPYFIPSLKYGVSEENFRKLKDRVLG